MRVFSVPPNGTWLSCGEGRRDREVDGREDERPFCSHELVGGVSGVVDCVLMHGFSEVSAEVAWSPKDNDRVHPWPDQRLHYCPFLVSDVCICDFQRQGSRFAAKVTLTTPWRHP